MHPRQTQSQPIEPRQPSASHPERDPAFDELLTYLRQNHGFDFTDYKPPSLMRRIGLRMHELGIGTYGDYTAYLQANPNEFKPLINTLWINFTGFFRDTLSWEYLVTDIIPRILRQKSADAPIRVWSAGCASGEEPYSLAIALAEALGIEQYQKRVRLFASDIDANTLHQARQGHYSALKMANMPIALRERYFKPIGNHYSVCSELRSPLLFLRHNLLEDPPMSQIDLLVCRNALIYFNQDGQMKTLVRFYFSLNRAGVLFLGSSELLPQADRLFKLLSVQHHMFHKVEKSSLTPDLLIQGLKRA
ncbi:hypothetical protein NDA01_31045 [Trichocoleus desertorum AS-A10]|uniref:CheR family methyltransferase n=1 Tax=Trichocoleus desertorum TaxID=1481672 RepID=UPI00329E291B